MQVKNILRRLKKAGHKAGLKKDGYSIEERHIRFSAKNYVFCMETCAIVTRSFGQITWQSTYLTSEEDVVAALLMEVK